MAEAEREVFEAGQRLEAAQAQYETIVHCMSRELARFQRERAAETGALLRDFAMSQVRPGRSASALGSPVEQMPVPALLTSTRQVGLLCMQAQLAGEQSKQWRSLLERPPHLSNGHSR